MHVVDDTTIAIPERPGNKRVDGFVNVLQRPRVGTVFLIPAAATPSGSTAPREYGRRRVLRRHDRRRQATILALEIDVDEVFFHCAKAFLRSDAWKPETWDPTAVPRFSQLAKAIKPDMSDQQLEVYYAEDNMRKSCTEPDPVKQAKSPLLRTREAQVVWF